MQSRDLKALGQARAKLRRRNALLQPSLLSTLGSKRRGLGRNIITGFSSHKDKDNKATSPPPGKCAADHRAQSEDGDFAGELGKPGAKVTRLFSFWSTISCGGPQMSHRVYYIRFSTALGHQTRVLGSLLATSSGEPAGRASARSPSSNRRQCGDSAQSLQTG